MRSILSFIAFLIFISFLHLSFAQNCGYTIVSDYTMSSNLSCSGTALIIGADHITLDCNGYTITTTDWGYGIYAYERRNITIKNCNIRGDGQIDGIRFESVNESRIMNTVINSSMYGIFLLQESSSNIFFNITLYSNQYGIYLLESSNNTLSNITANSNQYGIYLRFSSNNTLSNITANSNSEEGILIVRSNSNTLSNITSNFNGYGVRVEASSLNTLSKITSNLNSIHGIYLDYSSNNTLSSITAYNNSEIGIFLYSNSNYNILSNITANSNSEEGILIVRSNSNTLSNITSNFNRYGISFGLSSFNTLSNITSNFNRYGIYLFDSVSNTLSNISVNSNLDYGVYLELSFDNIIFNNFFNNTNNVYIEESANFWNTTLNCSGGPNIVGGPCIGGNFWATPSGTGYSQNCTDSNLDGICDDQYNISSQNVDYLPLTYGGSTSNAPSISLISPQNDEVFNYSSINFTFISIDDNSPILNCSLYINNVPISSNNSVLNNTLTTIPVFNLSSNRYTWYVSCSDNDNNIGNSESRSFNVSLPLAVCGNSVCESGENYLSCPSDCSPYCGDSICSYPENCSTCQADCGECNYTNCPPEYPIRCGTQCCPLGTTSCKGNLCCVARVGELCCGNTQYPCYVNGTPWCCNCPPNHYNCFGTCVNVLTSNSHCGTCGRACPTGSSCINGQCVSQNICGNGVCNEGETCSSCPQDCGQCPSLGECSSGQIRCAGRCVNPSTDPSNCGGCGNSCYPGQICSNGVCSCPSGLSLCNGQCINLLSNPNHCGACNVRCPSGICLNGQCAGSCPEGYTLINGTCIQSAICAPLTIPCGRSCCLPSQRCNPQTLTCEFTQCKENLIQCGQFCINPLNDPFNCGACNVRCPLNTYCSNGRCVPITTLEACPEGKIKCNNICTDISTDVFNCGACGRSCNIISEECVAGTCVPKTVCGFGQTPCGQSCCAAGQTCENERCTPSFCDENQIQCGLICIDPRNDNNNCGRCGYTCDANERCIDGRCVPNTCGNNRCDIGEDTLTCPQDCRECNPPNQLCNEKCVDINTDRLNCGACNNKCRLDWNCINGTCRGVLNSGCISDGDCEFGRCINGTCKLPNCRTDSDCRSNEYCNAIGVCDAGCRISPDNCKQLTGKDSYCDISTRKCVSLSCPEGTILINNSCFVLTDQPCNDNCICYNNRCLSFNPIPPEKSIINVGKPVFGSSAKSSPQLNNLIEKPAASDFFYSLFQTSKTKLLAYESCIRGSLCSSSADCCGAPCIESRCACSNSVCTTTADCCSGYCENGRCSSPPTQKLSLFNSLTAPNFGCSGLIEECSPDEKRCISLCNGMTILLVLVAGSFGAFAWTRFKHPVAGLVAAFTPILLGVAFYPFIGIVSGIILFSLLIYKDTGSIEV